LTGQLVVVTGASRGLGAAITRAFWDAGAHLLLVARSPADLGAVASALPQHSGQQAATFAADLADPGAAERIVNEARRLAGRVDVLVNSAAAQGPLGPVWQNDWDAWRMVVQVNLLAPVALSRLCVPLMAEQRHGTIINISGGGASAPRPNFSSYATTKAGLVRFSESLAEEVRHLGISVNCVAPGAMKTMMTDQVLHAGADAVGEKEYVGAVQIARDGGTPPGRPASLCVWLASPAARGITGKLLSAVWDPWPSLDEHADDLQRSDVYTLRRIVPKDRGLDWGS